MFFWQPGEIYYFPSQHVLGIRVLQPSSEVLPDVGSNCAWQSLAHLWRAPVGASLRTQLPLRTANAHVK